MRTDFFVFVGGGATSSSTIDNYSLNASRRRKARRGNTMVAVLPTRLRDTAIRVDEGSLRDGRGLTRSLRKAERVPGRHGGR
jgi:hypothetical protein